MMMYNARTSKFPNLKQDIIWRHLIRAFLEIVVRTDINQFLSIQNLQRSVEKKCTKQKSSGKKTKFRTVKDTAFQNFIAETEKSAFSLEPDSYFQTQIAVQPSIINVQ